MERLAHLSRAMYARWANDRSLCRAQIVSVIGFALMAILLFADNAFAQSQFQDGRYITVCKKVMDYIEGDFGALLTALAGIGAIVASAVGGFKVAWALIVVAIGTFILRNFIIGGQEGVGFFTGKC